MDKVYSAANQAVATIQNCEDEPIHIPGSIQPHGFLLAIDRTTGLIALCSLNTGEFLEHPAVYFLSKIYSSVLPEVLSAAVRTHLANAGSEQSQVPVTLLFGHRHYDCFFRMTGNYLLVEIVPAGDPTERLYSLLAETDRLINQAGELKGLIQLCQSVAERIRHLIGYERVMVYRFDEAYNGHVIAESISDGIESFYDLHYPHTDIPPQARELYLRNRVRLIADVFYEPVPIVTLDPLLARPELVDLSHVFIRSVSPIHIQYLKNMGVRASFSISLVKDGMLWGLVACHHAQPGMLPYATQMQAYLLSQILSSQIGAQETAEQYARTQQLRAPLHDVLATLQKEKNFIELQFARMPQVAALAAASGAVIMYKNKIYHNGLTPPNKFIWQLHEWLRVTGKTEFYTDQLTLHLPKAAAHEATASGVLYYRFDAAGETSLFWFRPSADREVTWAGDPSKQRERSPMTPRHSFAAWTVLNKGISEPWQQAERDAAFQCLYLLQQHIFVLHQLEEELRYRQLNEKLTRANKELENIHWISTNDLQEPLRKIQIFASLIDTPQSEMNVGHVKTSINRIKSSASRMQKFIGDLMLYARMSENSFVYEALDLNKILLEVLQEFEEERQQDLFTLEAGQLPALHASNFHMFQLFFNLIDNAIRFRKDWGIQQVKITCEMTHESAAPAEGTMSWLVIRVADTGVGFNEHMHNSIFDIFKKAHPIEKSPGTGVGLPICRKIMDNYGGKITASGIEGQGATFTLYFPGDLVVAKA